LQTTDFWNLDWYGDWGQVTKSIADIISSDEHDGIYIEQIARGIRPFPTSGRNGILIYGPPGTGKSSLARMLPDAMEMSTNSSPANEMYMGLVHDNNGVELISTISSCAMRVPYLASFHYFVIDELDLLTNQAMLQLKSAMNYPNTIFVMTTNYFDKIEQGIKSRCKCIHMDAAEPSKWLPLAHSILRDAQVHGISNAQLIPVIAQCDGDVRKIVDAILDIIGQKLHKVAITNQQTLITV